MGELDIQSLMGQADFLLERLLEYMELKGEKHDGLLTAMHEVISLIPEMDLPNDRP